MKVSIAHQHELQPLQWGAVVWAGPGYGSQLEAVLGLDAGQRVLLEPHPALGKRLVRRLHGAPAVVEPNALAAASGPVEFHLMSDPVRSTLLDPQSVLRKWPRLQHESSIQVDASTLEDLAASLELNAEVPNLLILDGIGIEQLLMESAIPACTPISHVLVGSDGAGVPVLIEGFDPPREHRSRAGQAWFLYVRRTSAGLVGPSDLLRKEGKRLRHRIGELESTLAESDQHRKTQARESAELKRQLEESRAGNERLERQLAELSQRFDQSRARVKALQDESAKLGEATAKAERLERQSAELSQRLEQSQAKVKALQEDIARQGKAQQARLREAEQTARLATRLQMVREQDLKDLRERYEASRRAQEDQHALLVQVSDRLGAAAAHFHSLVDEEANSAGHTEAVVIGRDEARDEPAAKKSRKPARKPRKRAPESGGGDRKR